MFVQVSTGRIQAVSCSVLLQSTHSATDSMIAESSLFLWSSVADTKRTAFFCSGLLLLYLLHLSSMHSFPQIQCSEQNSPCDQLGTTQKLALELCGCVWVTQCLHAINGFREPAELLVWKYSQRRLFFNLFRSHRNKTEYKAFGVFFYLCLKYSLCKMK